MVALLAPPLTSPAAAREITIKVTPTHGSDGEYFTAEGVGNCEDLRMIIEYDTYAGNHTSWGTDFRGTWDPKINGAPYKIKVRVPHTTRPGSADVYVAPYCGPIEEFPSSDGVKVTIDKARVRFTVSPSWPRVGQQVTITGTGCYGSTSAVAPVQIRWANGTLDRRVPLTRPRNAAIGDGHGFTVRTTAPPGAEGTATLSLFPDSPSGDIECPGTVLPAAVSFRVRPPYRAPATTAPPAGPADAPPSATARATATAAPAGPAQAPTPAPTATPTAGRATGVAHRAGVPVGVALPAVALLAAAAFGAARLRRTR
jgi:hypothetical protein